MFFSKFSLSLFVVWLVMTSAAAAQGLFTWRVDFPQPGSSQGDTVRDFDLRAPAVEGEVIVGLNYLRRQSPWEIHVYEALGNGSFERFVRLRDRDGSDLVGRSVVRSFDRRGYVIAGCRTFRGTVDSFLVLIRVDTSNTVQWAFMVEVADGQGAIYERVVPTKVIALEVDTTYLVSGYARRGEEQDVFVLKVDDGGQVQWVVLLKDVMSVDHVKSPLWCWDMESWESGEVVLVGSRVTEFVVPLPPAPCENERQQGWMVVIDGRGGVPISNGIYTDAQEQCVELRGVKAIEERLSGKRYVLSVGWGNKAVGVTSQTVYPAVYSGELWALSGGWVHLQWLGGLWGGPVGKAERDRYEDAEWWEVQDTVWGYVVGVGERRETGWVRERGQRWMGRYDKGSHWVGMVDGRWYRAGINGWMESLREVEAVDTVVYMSGYWGEYGSVWRTEGRVPRSKPGEASGDCMVMLFGGEQWKVGLYEEPMRMEIGSVQLRTLSLESVHRMLFSIDCPAYRP